MEFELFRKKMEDDIRDVISGLGGIYFSREFKKLQGDSYAALIVKKSEHPVAMSINMEKLYRNMEKGAPYEELLSEVIEQTREFLSDQPEVDISALYEYKQAKKGIFTELVGTERNREMLKEIPHKEIEDMSLVYRLDGEIYGQEDYCILITNNLLEEWGVTLEQLHQDAMEYGSKRQPLMIKTMARVMEEMLELPEGVLEGEMAPFYVVSNENRERGAAMLFYPEVLERCSES